MICDWRRRPDLNRGWRFCRQGRDAYLVDSSCFLVGPTPPFSLVFGRNCSQIVPTFADPQMPLARIKARPGAPLGASGVGYSLGWCSLVQPSPELNALSSSRTWSSRIRGAAN